MDTLCRLSVDCVGGLCVFTNVHSKVCLKLVKYSGRLLLLKHNTCVFPFWFSDPKSNPIKIVLKK